MKDTIGPITDIENFIWWRLMKSLRLRPDDPTTTYGEISLSKYGHSRGGQGLRYPLDRMGDRLRLLGVALKTNIPPLQGLVVSRKGQPGEGFFNTHWKGSYKSFLAAVRKFSIANWLSFGESVGYRRVKHWPRAATRTHEYFGFDPGVEASGTRRMTVFTPRHNPIARKLRARCRKLGWLVLRAKQVRPDLLVEKRRKSALFEIKPSASFNELVMGIAQLIVYNDLLRADVSVLVAPAESNICPYFEALRQVAEAHNIEIQFYASARSITFPGLAGLLKR